MQTEHIPHSEIGYFRWELDDKWYCVETTQNCITVWVQAPPKAGSDSVLMRTTLPRNCVDFDPAHPEPLIEKIKVLESYA